jgi:hypothetical protein
MLCFYTCPHPALAFPALAPWELILATWGPTRQQIKNIQIKIFNKNNSIKIIQ